ncbi:MAG: FAD-dependent oxidoreductase [Candidatus Omnitrophota bacterium]
MAVEFETDVLEVISRTSRLKSFRFRIKETAVFKPGQFFSVTIKVKGREETKYFSFSNSPTEQGYLEFTKRITESEFSKALDELKPGSWARLNMAYGNFTFEGEYPKLAFLSGGIGITPLRSICKFTADKKLSTDIVLIYSNDKEEGIIFKRDLDEISSANKNIRVVYTLTSSGVDKQVWPGRTGYIDDKMIKQEIPDYQERVFYACGPPKMVENLTTVLKNGLSISQDKIKVENFAGY